MKRVFIAAHYNLNNGDRAVLEATIQGIQRNFENSEIVISAYEPELLRDERIRCCVSWPIKKGKVYNIIFRYMCRLGLFQLLRYMYPLIVDKQYLQELRSADVVFVSGGHHLTDILGIDICYQLGLSYLMPIIVKKKVYLLPQSIGPISNKQVRRDVKYILKYVNKIAYRDKSSEAFLKTLNIDTDMCYVPDVVYSINQDNDIQSMNKSIGIALYCNYSGVKRKELMPRVIEALRNTIEALIDKGYFINIIPMEIKGSQADDRFVAENIIQKLDYSLRSSIRIAEPETNSILSVIDLFKANEVNIAYKTHSVVFSMVCKVPVVAVAYHPKSIEFMKSIGLERYAVNDVDAASDKLLELIFDATENKNEIIMKETEGVEYMCEKIDSYIREILEEA